MPTENRKRFKELQQELERKDSEVRAIITACEKITSSLRLEEVLRFIQESACNLMNAESSSVILLDSSGKYLKIASSTGTKEEQVTGLSFPSDKGIAGWVIQHSQPVIVNDAESDSRFYHEIDQISGYRTKSICCVPMIFQEKILGVVEVLNYRRAGGFPESKLELFGTFANLAAIALNNAISFDDLSSSYRLLHDQMLNECIDLSENRDMQKIYELCRQVAPLDSTVLLQGESGTGKEILADMVHRLSSRRNKPLTKVNLATLPENLVESELFGHEKGAFTGAVARKKGRFEQAHRGTIFLDEIGELKPDIQVKLLRFLQEHTFERVGGSETLEVDARFIAATNRNLEEAVLAGEFRKDLFYRLNVVPVAIPALRERKEDIPVLVDFFIRKFNRELNRKVKGISTEALSLLLNYPWPGNIRELENIIERILVMRNSGDILPKDIPREIVCVDLPGGLESGNSDPGKPHRMWDLERDLIEKTLQVNSFNQSKSARDLGITLNQLRYRIKKYNIRFR